MNENLSPVLNQADAEERSHLDGEHWGGHYKVLTPYMNERGGKLGVNLTRLPPGRVLCPYHYHALEDEVFYIISGTGILRYADELYEIKAGDCISCPSGVKEAHQIANTGEVDLVYLAIGPNEPNEICVYPDSGKVLIRSEKQVGEMTVRPYMHGELALPPILDQG